MKEILLLRTQSLLRSREKLEEDQRGRNTTHGWFESTANSIKRIDEELDKLMITAQAAEPRE